MVHSGRSGGYPVEVEDAHMADMQTVIANGDHAAVDRIYNRMVQIMDAAARARATDPDAP